MARKLQPQYKRADLIREVVNMFASGQSQYEILQWLGTEGECSISYSYDVLREAKPIIVETLRGISKERLEMTINELEKTKTEAKLFGDKRLALEIQKEINKISGLYADKVDITTGGKDLPSDIKIIFLDGNAGHRRAEEND